MRKSSSKPALMKLTTVAREIGVGTATIEKNVADFFSIKQFGHQRYVLTTDFENWVAQHATGPSHAETD